MYDIGIVGGGTAGMTAAIYGQRAGKNVILFEAENFGGQIVTSARVDNYPGLPGISGAEYALNLQGQAETLGTETVRAQVTAVKEGSSQDEGCRWVLQTAKGEYPCRTVILAGGVTHRHLGVPGESELSGMGVSYCATCDGMFFRGRDVAVVGGGNTALEDAEFLSAVCRKVWLIHRRDELRGEESIAARLRKKDNVEFLLSCVVTRIFGENMVEGAEILNKKTGETSVLPASGVFLAVGQIPQNDRFADIVRLDGDGYILAAEDCMTSAPGVFAAGDCRTKEVRQLVTAAADGAAAALAACRYMSENP